MTSTKPTPADIMTAIAKAEAGDWIDTLYEPIHWHCELYAPDGKLYGNGSAHTAAQAMAMAWLAAWAPDALIDAYVEIGSVPFVVPDGYRFELTPPWKSSLDDWNLDGPDWPL
jgi:hypothetical protein